MLFFEFAHIWNCNHQKATWCHHLFNNGTFRFLMKYMSVIDLRRWRKGWNVRNCVTLIIISRSYQIAYWNIWWFSNYLFILNTNNIFKVCYSIYQSFKEKCKNSNMYYLRSRTCIWMVTLFWPKCLIMTFLNSCQFVCRPSAAMMGGETSIKLDKPRPMAPTSVRGSAME